MKTKLCIIPVLLILLVSGCREEVKEVAQETVVKIDSSKLTPNISMLNREFNISYAYQGREAYTGNPIQRKLGIKLTLFSYDTSNTYTSTLKLKVKNTSFEPFVLEGSDIFLLKKEELLGDLVNNFYRIDISPGKELEFTIPMPKSIASNADLIDIKKRSKDGLISAFQIKLK